MMIKTILNNNAVIAIDENEKEVVIVKNGIGFNSKKGMVLKDNEMCIRDRFWASSMAAVLERQS